MLDNSLVCLPQAVVPVARPFVLAGIIDHAGAQGVEFDVAHAGQQVGVSLDEAGFVAAFPQAAGAFVVAVDVLDVAAANGLHEPGYAVLGFRRYQQMNVVGHEHVGMNGAVPIGSRFLEPMEVAVIILLGEETGLSINAALDDMLGQSGQFDAGATGHVCRLSKVN